MAGGLLWTPLEVKKLRLLAGQMPITRAVQFFPQRTRLSLIQKAHALDLLWRDRRRFICAQEAARTLGISTERLLALAQREGIPDSRYGEGPRAPHAFRPEDVSRIADALAWGGTAERDHPDFELYRCRSCEGETLKRWRWRYTTDAYRCGHKPLCHRCRVYARTRPRGEASVMLARTTRRAHRALREVKRLGGAR